MKYLCLAVLFLATLPGCRLQEGRGDGVVVIQPSDIPVPAGMRLQARRSDTLEVRKYRYANLVYAGNTPPMQIVAYLLERMPHHWDQLVSQETSDDEELLVFKRGAYTAECSVRRLEFGTQLDYRIRTNPKQH